MRGIVILGGPNQVVICCCVDVVCNCGSSILYFVSYCTLYGSLLEENIFLKLDLEYFF